MLNNYLAEIKEKICTCDKCNGSGEIELSKDELVEYLQARSIPSALSIYRTWRTNEGKVYCSECDGLGSWVKQY